VARYIILVLSLTNPSTVLGPRALSAVSIRSHNELADVAGWRRHEGLGMLSRFYT
jgi:hypothetical protein